MIPDKKMDSFKEELRNLINRYGLESGSNTPDYVLVEYFFGCLRAYNNVTHLRDRWWNNKSLEGVGNEKKLEIKNEENR